MKASLLVVEWTMGLLLFRKSAWYSVIKLFFSRNYASLSLTTLSNVLQTQLVRDIEKQFVGIALSFAGLGTGMTIACFPNIGLVLFVHMSLKACNKYFRTVSGNC